MKAVTANVILDLQLSALAGLAVWTKNAGFWEAATFFGIAASGFLVISLMAAGVDRAAKKGKDEQAK
jgi:hypothetical protein